MNHSTQLLIELYKRKDFKMMPLFDKQIKALQYLEDDITNEVGYGGAARGGKSVLGCFWKILRRMSMPNSYGLIARNEYSKLRDTTIRSYFQTLNKIGLQRDVDYKASGVPLTIEYFNGSIEFFREIKYYPSDPEFDRLGSYDLTDAFLDEAQQIHWKARNILKGRFSITNGDTWHTIPKTLYTFNPSKNWVYNEFYKPHNDNTLEITKQFIPALPNDNPHVPQSFFDNLQNADEVTKQRLLYGNFEYDDDPSALCDYDAILDMFTNESKPGQKRLSADLAMQGRDKFITMLQNGNVITVVIDKKKSTAKEIEDGLNEQKRINGVPNTSIVADSDGLGQYLSAYIRNIKTFHGGSTKMTKENQKIYFNLKSACAYKLAEKINNREIVIKCSAEQEEEIKKEISMCLKRDNVDSDGKLRILSKDKMKEYLGHSPDYLDTLIMLQYWDIIKLQGSPIM